MSKTRLVNPSRILLLFIVCIFCSKHLALAQNIEVVGGHNPPYTPETLVENILLGKGVNVISTQFFGDAKAIGYFTKGDHPIGIGRGVVLSTGFAEDAMKANTYDSNNPFGGVPDANGNTSGASVSDPDLLTLTNGGALRDIAKIEITFQPLGDSLQFNYVFASEEYPIYACLNYNDVFGFFISGPKPGGGSYMTENIALVPNSNNLPVSINNVHNGNPANPACTPVNNQFYNDNSGNASFAYNAYLDMFTATIGVVPCATYTLKLAIGDGSLSGNDDNFDSAVFLEAKSFESATLAAEAVSVSLDGTLVEGCTQGALSFSLPTVAPADYPLTYQFSGTAIMGTDYEDIPNNLFIPAGDSTVQIPIIPIIDNLPEGKETIIVEVISNICKKDTFNFFLEDQILIPPQLGNDTTICAGSSVQLDGQINLPLPPPQSFTQNSNLVIDDADPNFLASPTAVYSPLMVTGVSPQTLTEGMIQQVCVDISHPIDEQLDILLISPDGQFVELSTDNGGSGSDYSNTCFSPTAPISILGNGDPAPSSDAPFTGTFLPEGVWSDLWAGNYGTNGTWQLLLKDDTYRDLGMLNQWSITFNSLYQLHYQWSPAAGLSCTDCPNPVATPASTTTYYLNVTDSYGCEVMDSITITIEEDLPAPVIDCAAQTASSVDFVWNVIVGASGYEVRVNGNSWGSPNLGPFGHQVTGLGLSEMVSIEVRGTGNCGANIGVGSCISSGCLPPQLTVSEDSPVSCPGANDASITVSASGGAPPYTFLLNNVSNTHGAFSQLAAGIYTLEVSSSDGCTTKESIEIKEPAPLALSFDATPESCLGQQDGTATVIAAGGTPPYTYNWDAGTGSQTSSTAMGLAGGSYGVVVNDRRGCSATLNVKVLEGADLSLNFDQLDPSCSGGTDGWVAVEVTGGKAPFTYQWDSTNADTSSQVTGLRAGSYSVTATDASGCTATGTASLADPTGLNTSYTSQPSSCFNLADGQAEITASGGSGSYTYEWSDIGLAITHRTDLYPGFYTVTVSDSRGCSKVVDVEISAPPMISLSVNTTDLSCFESNDGKAVATASGGTGNFSYKWGDPGNQSGPSASGLSAGPLKVTITDASGCQMEASAQIEQPKALVISTTAGEIQCSGDSSGSLTAFTTGGTGNYSFEWNDVSRQTTPTATQLSAGQYTVTVTDGQGCQATTSATLSDPQALTGIISVEKLSCIGVAENELQVEPGGGTGPYQYIWSDPQQQRSAKAVGLAHGQYFVTVTDQPGCQFVDSITLVAPASITVSLSAIPASCYGEADGTVSGQATGGQGTLKFQWSNGSTGKTQNGLPAGEYCVTVTDEKGCNIKDCIQVVQPEEIIPNPDIRHNDCIGENEASISLSPNGGQDPYEYLWIGPKGFYSKAQDIQDLASGNYFLTMTDAKGCTQTQVVTITKPVDINVVFDIEHIDCYGNTNGHILARIQGGNAPFNYSWSTGSTQASIGNLSEGDYHLTITDSFGCSYERKATIESPSSPFAADFEIQAISCSGAKDGAFIFHASGGTPQYSYSLDNKNFTPYPGFYSLIPGVYNLYAQDNNGCMADTIGVVLEEPEPLEIELGPDHNIHLGDEVDLAPHISNAVGTQMSYQWSSTEGQIFSCQNCQSQTVNTLFTTMIELRVIDENGCSGEDQVQIMVTKDRKILVPTGFSPNGDGNNDLLGIYGQKGTRILNFEVFDRWGEQLYELKDFEIDNQAGYWNGRFRGLELKGGIYIWKAEVKFIDGYVEKFSGETTLIR